MNATTETQTDIHCLCTVCSGKIAFPPEMLEQTIQCPHCKMDTRLYRAPDALKPLSPPQKPIPKTPEPLPPEPEKPIEDSLNQIGLVYLIGGCVAAGVIILYGFSRLDDYNSASPGEILTLFISALICVGFGVIFRTLFRAAATVIQLLRQIVRSLTK